VPTKNLHSSDILKKSKNSSESYQKTLKFSKKHSESFQKKIYKQVESPPRVHLYGLHKPKKTMLINFLAYLFFPLLGSVGPHSVLVQVRLLERVCKDFGIFENLCESSEFPEER
jgi:hypothetical protein